MAARRRLEATPLGLRGGSLRFIHEATCQRSIVATGMMIMMILTFEFSRGHSPMPFR